MHAGNLQRNTVVTPVAKSRAKPKSKKPKLRAGPIAVKRGQIYQYRPAKKGAHMKYLRIVGIQGKNNPPPTATYRQITRSGRLIKPQKSLPIMTWLQWNGKAWDLGFGELVEE